MDTKQLEAWVQIGEIAVSAAIATVDDVRAWMAGQHPVATDTELDAVCDAIGSRARARKAIADAEIAQG